jgi:hypothetical protein
MAECLLRLQDKDIFVKANWSEPKMEKLSVEQLLETLNKAIELNLKQDFINLIVNELDRKRFILN